MTADLRRIYSAPTADLAAAEKYASIAPAWRRAWQEVTLFSAFDPAIRKSIKTRGSFPTEEAATKPVFLAIRNFEKGGGNVRDWFATGNQFALIFEERIKDGKPYIHSRIAHDDISVSANWQTKIDPKITQLNCSVSAAIRSGYVVRCDVVFDPTIDPREFIEDADFGVARGSTLRKQYRNSKGNFTAPLLYFQRPTARFDELAPFSAAEKRLRPDRRD